MARDRANRPGAKPLRLFVAADVPEPVREAVRGAVEPLRERFPKARWVPTPNQHVTLKFLGPTWPRLLEWVTEVLGQVAARHAPFETHVGAFSAFPTERRARVLWAALDDPAERFGAIAGDLEDALAKEFPREKRAFTPHLTVARFEPPVNVGELLADAGVGSDRFAVDRIVLYQSTLKRPAPVYEELITAPLDGP
jgi:2'-5' RNA ligase